MPTYFWSVEKIQFHVNELDSQIFHMFILACEYLTGMWAK